MPSNPSRTPDQEPAGPLSLFAPEELRRWQGLPILWMQTPQGAWAHRFTPNSTGVALLESGSISCRFAVRARTTDVVLDAGSMAVFNAGAEVKVQQHGARDARRILLELDTHWLVRHRLVDDDLVSMPLQHGLQFRDHALEAVVREMVREVRQGCPNGSLFAESLSLGVALHLCRTRGMRTPPAQRERGKLALWQWTRIDELITSDLSSDLSLSALAAAVNLSKPHFMRLFRNTAGTSPHRFVLRRRAERALQLIRSSSASLADVAASAGFASQSHLTRVFVATFGMTPGEARRQAALKA